MTKQEMINKLMEQAQIIVQLRKANNQPVIDALEKVKEEAKHYGFDFSKSMNNFCDKLIRETKNAKISVEKE